MPTPQKEATVSALREHLEKAHSLVLTDYRGLSVQEINELRAAMRKEGIRFAVVKNTLFNLALEGTGAEALRPLLVGPTAAAFSEADAVATAKVLVQLAKGHEKLVIKGGFSEGRLYTAEDVRLLSEVPPREELLARFVGSLQAPLTAFVFTLQSIISALVFTLQAVADKRAEKAA